MLILAKFVRDILMLMKSKEIVNDFKYTRKDLVKSLFLSLGAIAILIALYYVWK